MVKQFTLASFILLLASTLAFGQGAARPAHQVIIVDDVEALTQMHTTDSPQPADGQLVETRGWHDPGDGGGNLYRYDYSSTDTVDGVTVLDGLAGDNSVATLGATTTTAGTGVGRFEVLNDRKVTTAQAGCHESALTDAQQTVRAQAALDQVNTVVVSAFTHEVSTLTFHSGQTIVGESQSQSIIKLGYDGGPAPAGVLGGVTQTLLEPATKATAETTDVCIKGFTLDGSRDTVDFSAVVGDGSAHGLAPWGVRRLVCADMTIKNCWTDSIYVVGVHEIAGPDVANAADHVYSNLILENTSRNGITVISGVRLGFSNIVVDTVDRIAPKFAIDCEANGNTTYAMSDIHFDNIMARQCIGLLTTSNEGLNPPGNRITISNSSITDIAPGVHQVIRAQSGTHVTASNISSDDWSDSYVFLCSGNNSPASLIVSNSRVTNCQQFARVEGDADLRITGCFADGMRQSILTAVDGATMLVESSDFHNFNTADDSNWTAPNGGAHITVRDCTFTGGKQGVKPQTGGTIFLEGCRFDTFTQIPVNVRDTSRAEVRDCVFVDVNSLNTVQLFVSASTDPRGLIFENVRVEGAASSTPANLTDILNHPFYVTNTTVADEVTHAGPQRFTNGDVVKFIGSGNTWQRKTKVVTAATQIHAEKNVRIDAGGSVTLDEHANWDGNTLIIQNNSGGLTTVGVVAAPATITGNADIADGDTGVFRSDGTTFHRLEGI